MRKSWRERYPTKPLHFFQRKESEPLKLLQQQRPRSGFLLSRLFCFFWSFFFWIQISSWAHFRSGRGARSGRAFVLVLGRHFLRRCTVRSLISPWWILRKAAFWKTTCWKTTCRKATQASKGGVDHGVM